MRVVIAIDSFKGSLTSMEAGNAAKEGILRANPQAEVIVKPLADGGEGTTDALIEGLGGSFVTAKVTGPLGGKTTAKYGVMNDNETAVIEMAEASGIILVNRNDLEPHIATTYGVGEMIADAIKRGCRKFIVGIGGSATTDGGVGMLQALGYDFFDSEGKLDFQTAMGKVPIGVARLAKKYNNKVIAFAGGVKWIIDDLMIQ